MGMAWGEPLPQEQDGVFGVDLMQAQDRSGRADTPLQVVRWNVSDKFQLAFTQSNHPRRTNLRNRIGGYDGSV